MGLLASAATAAPSAPPIAGGNSAGEASQPIGGAPAGGGAAPSGNPFGLLLPLILIFGVMILMQVFAGRKQKKQRTAMLSSLARHDRVQTVGGLIGTVAEVKETEILLKVDEATNTKVRVVRSAVQAVLKKAGGPGAKGGSADSVEEPEEVPA